MREDNPLLGDLDQEFNFSGPPSPPTFFPRLTPGDRAPRYGRHFEWS